MESVRGASSVLLEGQAWYIFGGYIPTTGKLPNQLFALDLTQPNWVTSQPHWIFRPPPPQNVSSIFHYAGLTLDQKEIVILGGGKIQSRFNLATGSWSIPTTLSPSFTTEMKYLRSVTDPLTGIMYIPAAYNSSRIAAPLESLGMMVYDTGLDVAVGVAMPSFFSDIRKYALVWNPLRGTVVAYGGSNAENTVHQNKLVEYSPTSKQWNELPPSGDPPPAIDDGCLASVYGGKKMVLFAGWAFTTPGGQASGSVYIYDVALNSWEKGDDIRQELWRSDHVCTSVGDNFIAWGGMNILQRTGLEVPVIYNLKTKKWTDQYIASGIPSPSDPSPAKSQETNDSGSGSKPESGGESNGAAVGGGIAAAVFILGLFCAFVFIRRRKARRAAHLRMETDKDNRHLSDKNSSTRQSDPLGKEEWMNNAFVQPRNPQLEPLMRRRSMGEANSAASPQEYPPASSTLDHSSSPLQPPQALSAMGSFNTQNASQDSLFGPSTTLGSQPVQAPQEFASSLPGGVDSTGTTTLERQIAGRRAQHEREMRVEQQRLEELEMNRQITLQRQAMDRLRLEQASELERLESSRVRTVEH